MILGIICFVLTYTLVRVITFIPRKYIFEIVIELFTLMIISASQKSYDEIKLCIQPKCGIAILRLSKV